MHHVICYDVSNDKKRTHIYRILKDEGHHLQKSVFALQIPKSRVMELLEKIKGHLEDTDRVLLLELCEECYKKRTQIGKAPPMDEDVWVY